MRTYINLFAKRHRKKFRLYVFAAHAHICCIFFDIYTVQILVYNGVMEQSALSFAVTIKSILDCNQQFYCYKGLLVYKFHEP